MPLLRNHLSIRRVTPIVLVLASLAACSAGGSGPAASYSPAKVKFTTQNKGADKAVLQAEAAVQASPSDASTRAMLGHAYAKAGRFLSATQSFSDAIALGDSQPRTIISLALAQTGAGDQMAAIATLDHWEATLDAGDFGLAIALAGQPDRGISALSNAIQSGQNTVKMRQNLAYAYALSGQWHAARLMVAEDLPADQIGDRMAQWGTLSGRAMTRIRIAHLLGTNIKADDPGQPAILALPEPSSKNLTTEVSDTAAMLHH